MSKSFSGPVFAGILLVLFSYAVTAQTFTYSDSWGQAGYSITSSRSDGLKINYSIQQFSIGSQEINRETLNTVELPGYFLPNDEGAPNLPGGGRYIAIPSGASISVRVAAMRTETLNGIDLAPAPKIPLDTEEELVYEKNEKIYSKNAFYPEKPVQLSEVTQVRGVDMVMVGITPFQYNPVTKELVVYRDMEIEITIKGGNGRVGDDRLRSRWWDPILEDMLLNPESLPEVDYSRIYHNTRELTGCEYLIVTPNGPAFQQWADTIRNFRTLQGILTHVVTLADIGGNSVAILKDYFTTAYEQWDIPPAAVLLLGDYGTNADSLIISPIWDSYCASDNIFADIDGNDMPDIVFARMTARNEEHLQTMVTKFIQYETNPPVNPGFYDHPITALGWQTERWFQICSETIGGYMKNIKGKDPVRINAIYEGNPNSDPWSTAPNTNTVLNYFGPNGLGYIPATPDELGGWSGGTAAMVNNAINEGAFILQHRDHGGEDGWGEPYYLNSHISGLNNTDLTFVFSINCLTGKYNMNGECFTEKFHRYKHNGTNSGALGLIAASEVSYSFVNDAFVWGLYDNMWPDFMPSYGTTPPSRGQLPSFGNAAGKYFLQQSSWPYNTSSKEVTYHLFHHHGDAFLTLFSEVPQNLTVIHDPVLLSGTTQFTVNADEGSLICITVDGTILGVTEGTGQPLAVDIEPQTPPSKILVTVTKQNHYRYATEVEVIPPEGPYVVFNAYAINDSDGNGNNQMDYGETIKLSMTARNVGIEEAQAVVVTITTSDPYITITNQEAQFGNIPPSELATITDAFAFEVSESVPDGHLVNFEMIARDINDSVWMSAFNIKALAPMLTAGLMEISDPTGNGNGRLDPGETVEVTIHTTNTGHSHSLEAIASLYSGNPSVTIHSNHYTVGEIPFGETAQAVFTITANEDIPFGTPVDLSFSIEAGAYSASKLFVAKVGLILEDWEEGSFAGFNWQFSGNANWMITDVNPYEGDYCAQSGQIGNSQSSQLRLFYKSLVDDSISFYRKVSSESGYDFLEFYIDNTRMGQWSGELDWDRVAFPVTAGSHTFKWVYTKDYYVTNGFDRGWIDYISFPPPLITTAYAGPDSTLCEGETIQLHGTATNVYSVQWSTSGTGTFSDPHVLDPSYTPGEEDYQSGEVTLSLTVISPEEEEVSDETVLYFVPQAMVHAGDDLSVCEGEVMNISLAAAENFSGLHWSTSGDGMFDDSSLLHPVYTPGPQDIFNGSVTLMLTATNAPCEDAMDEVILTIHPNPAPAITGEISVCLTMEPVNYSTPDDPGCAYTWQVTGGSILEGENTHEVTVEWNQEGEGMIAVTEMNETTQCATTVELPVMVYPLPQPVIMGSAEVCLGETDIFYQTEAIEGHTYEWTVAGGSYVPGSGSNEIIVTWNEAGTGRVSVVETITETGCFASTQSDVTINALPVVSIGNDTSMCHNHTISFDAGHPDAQSWLWSTGETTRTITVDSAGVGYSGQKEIAVTVTDANGCSGGAAIMLTIEDCTGIGENSYELGVNIFPNPGKGHFTLELDSPVQDVVNLFILDARGVKVYENNNLELNRHQTLEIDLSGISEGMYLLTIQGDGIGVVKKLMIQR